MLFVGINLFIQFGLWLGNTTFSCNDKSDTVNLGIDNSVFRSHKIGNYDLILSGQITEGSGNSCEKTLRNLKSRP